MKKQVVIIGGGDTFATYEEYINFLRTFEMDIERLKRSGDDWKPWLRGALGDEYEVILPKMPNAFNAQYEEWKIWFEKLFPFLNDGIVLIGHSLGGIFLAKYLSENTFPKKIGAVFFIAAVYDKDCDGYSPVSFALPEDFAEKANMQTDNIFLYHSKNDPVVPFSALEQYMSALPNAHARIFEDKKHFNQSEFPELAEDILNI